MLVPTLVSRGLGGGGVIIGEEERGAKHTLLARVVHLQVGH